MVVAIVGKVVTGWCVVGQPGINRLTIGIGMIPRGEVGLVFAGIGSASGALGKPSRCYRYGDSNDFSRPLFLRIAFSDSTQSQSSVKSETID